MKEIIDKIKLPTFISLFVSGVTFAGLVMVFAYDNFQTKAEAEKDIDFLSDQIILLRSDIRELTKRIDQVLQNAR